MSVRFITSPQDSLLILEIADRISAVRAKYNLSSEAASVLDISACHLNGSPIDLEGLLAADDLNFIRDVFGIYHHLDRATGKLIVPFTLRYAALTPTPAAPPCDQVFQLTEGWFAMVDGKMFGPWALKQYAKAGLQTEQRRASARTRIAA